MRLKISKQYLAEITKGSLAGCFGRCLYLSQLKKCPTHMFVWFLYDRKNHNMYSYGHQLSSDTS